MNFNNDNNNEYDINKVWKRLKFLFNGEYVSPKYDFSEKIKRLFERFDELRSFNENVENLW